MTFRQIAAALSVGLWLPVLTFAQPANKDPLLLNMVWRAEIATGDFMDTVSRAEFDNFPGSGLSYYLPGENGSGYVNVFRHRNNTSGQHLPSNFNTIDGSTFDGRIGFAFPSATSTPGGLTPLARLHDATTGDRFLALPGETRPGYTTQSMDGYGWARNLTNNENLISLSGGGVSIQSNLNAGGSLWRWTHNGKQYINTRDYGRQIQSAYIAQNDLFKDSLGKNRYINPTEGGTRFSDLAVPAARRQGSPLISASNDVASKTQRTRSAALDWDPSLFGGDQDHPVYFQNTVLGKNITLDDQGRGAVARYETVLRVPYEA